VAQIADKLSRYFATRGVPTNFSADLRAFADLESNPFFRDVQYKRSLLALNVFFIVFIDNGRYFSYDS
jgi:hypothetical protein